MRIIAGTHKGRALKAPDGEATRPTSDRARESLFNIYAHADWAPPLAGARVIDLFAGSGALGLEAMSRGAAFCLFVETDAAARGAIRDNIEALGLFGSTRLHRRSAIDLGAMPAALGAPFDFALLDPPYRQGLIAQALAALTEGGWLAESAIVMAESASDERLAFPGWTVLDGRDYGAAHIDFLTRA
jgi:16S rRNA (guanine966-N2)-methyltransferase